MPHPIENLEPFDSEEEFLEQLNVILCRESGRVVTDQELKESADNANALLYNILRA